MMTLITYGIPAFISVALIASKLLSCYRQKIALINDLRNNNNEIKLKNESLEQAAHFKRTILSVVSHDVRGPLNSLTGLLALLERGALTNDEATFLMKKVAAAAKPVKGLVDDLLVWANDQLINPTLTPSFFQIDDEIQTTINALLLVAENKNIKIETFLRPVEIFADKEMVKIAIRNILSNAIKFSRPNDVIRVNLSHDGRNAVFSVLDHGLGMNEDHLKDILEGKHFTTLGTKNEVGTGMGLMLSKEFIEKNGGKIHVKSKLGSGSQFGFSIPRCLVNPELLIAN